MDDGTNIKTLHPCINRPVVEQTKIRSIPGQRTGQVESRRQNLTPDTEPFALRVNLKLSSREPGAIGRECEPAEIAVAKNRRIQNIDRFVVETFKNRAGKVFVRIDD